MIENTSWVKKFEESFNEKKNRFSNFAINPILYQLWAISLHLLINSVTHPYPTIRISMHGR